MKTKQALPVNIIIDSLCKISYHLKKVEPHEFVEITKDTIIYPKILEKI